MAWRQGTATISVRNQAAVILAGSIVRGARRDWRGDWHGLSDADFDAFHVCTPFSVPDEELGRLLRRALKATRLNTPVPVAWSMGLWSDKLEYDLRLAAAFGLESSGGLYRGMLACGVRWLRGKVTLHPTRRLHGGRFEAFEPAWIEGHEDVLLPFGSSDRELGAAMRACISRCA